MPHWNWPTQIVPICSMSSSLRWASLLVTPIGMVGARQPSGHTEAVVLVDAKTHHQPFGDAFESLVF
jgi:hypothetical protein